MGAGGKKGQWGARVRGALQPATLMEKTLIQSLDLVESKQDPEPTLIRKDMIGREVCTRMALQSQF